MTSWLPSLKVEFDRKDVRCGDIFYVNQVTKQSKDVYVRVDSYR